MRYCKYILIFLIAIPTIKLNAQEKNRNDIDITGLWKGTQFNDSTQLYYRFEIAISREKGKYTGYSHIWFIMDDKQYYGVKKVKIRREEGKIIVQDDKLIANNYPVQPPKGVRTLCVLELDAKDSIMKLTGPFETNRTRDWAPVTGTVSLERKNDYWQSSLVPHLQELGVVKELSFVEDTFALEKNIVAVTTTTPKQITVNPTVKTRDNKAVAIPKVAPGKKPAIDSLSGAALATNSNKPVDAKPIIPEKNILPAAEVSSRVTIAQQTVYFKSDSLQLSLYDNGEVDGDTVSVLMNGSIIIPKQRLSTTAFRKTIFIEPQQDSIQLLMYAENLGAIPPNTGLLVVKDGRETYEVRFSGDLQKNAAVIFRRKK